MAPPRMVRRAETGNDLTMSSIWRSSIRGSLIWGPSLWGDLKGLLFPVQCAGCGQWDTDLCRACAGLAHRDVSSRVLDDATGIPSLELLCLGPYDGALRGIIVSAKHDPARDLTDFLFRCGTHLGFAAARRLAQLFAHEPSFAPRPGGVGESGFTRETRGVGESVFARESGFARDLWLVPAPPSHARRRKRREIVPSITAGMARALQGCGWDPQVVEAVSLRVGRRGQGGRGVGGRWRGRRNAFVVRERPPPTVPVILVDDVVASGATIRALADHFEDQVLFAAAVSAA